MLQPPLSGLWRASGSCLSGHLAYLISWSSLPRKWCAKVVGKFGNRNDRRNITVTLGTRLETVWIKFDVEIHSGRWRIWSPTKTWPTATRRQPSTLWPQLLKIVACEPLPDTSVEEEATKFAPPLTNEPLVDLPAEVAAENLDHWVSP